MSAAGVMRRALEDGKGRDIASLPAARQSGGLFEFMVVATANSARHAGALAERVRMALKHAGRACHIESSEDKNWILVDAGEAIAHIMLAESRERYDLERLWGFEETSEE